jgi:beta-galactosidase GanA
VNVLDPAKTYYITNDGASITTLSLSTNEAEKTATLGYELNPLKNSTTIYGTKWTIESGDDVIELGAATGATTTVTAKKAGTATVKLTLATKQTEGGDADFTTGTETVSVTVTVTTPATAVKASLDSVVSTPNGNSVVTLSLPNGTNDPVDSITGIVAASGDKSVATVSVDSTNKQLNITGVKNGTAKIVAVVSTKNGAVLTKVITVTVETPTLNLPATLNAEGNTVNASVDGTTDAIESVAWESSNTDVATVGASGTSTTVTASENASAQDVTITATVTYKGGAQAVVSGTINVTYNAPEQD